VTVTAPSTVAPERIPQGGVVRVGVWGKPDPEAATLTGATIRSLTQPQLFVAQPDGTWAPSLVEPGSDVDGDQFRSATFRLREGAVWSDGSKIQGGHLWESADHRFVTEVDVADDGLYTVSFNQPLPGWRRLWSGAATVEPPEPGLFGGAWRVESANPELEVVLIPNESWWGERPNLDELRLVVVPDQGVLYDLFADGAIDVIAPNAATGRLPTLAELAPGRVDTALGSGWWVGMTSNPERINEAQARALLGSIDADFFVGALLKGEAVVGSLGGDAVRFPEAQLTDISDLITITVPDDVAMLGAVKRAALLAVRTAGGTVPELRDAASDLVDPWIAAGDFEASIELFYDGLGGPCWTCRFGNVDEAAARLADGGGDPLDTMLAETGVARLLWRPIQAVAWAENVNGVVANGWALSSAWNANEWWVG